VYSTDPRDDTLGGLASDGHFYNRSYAGNPPGSIAEVGDLLLYSVAPVLTFTADDTSKVYGAAVPALTYSVGGLINGDLIGDAVTGSPSLTTTADASTSVGTAAITTAAGTLAATLGYTLNVVDGTLTITPAPLTITAHDKSKVYGAANPVLTAGFSGFVNGDSSAVVCGLTLATPATAGSGAGSYAITPADATAANYDITFVSGTLTVTQAPLTISADDKSKVYGAANPALTASYSGFVNGDSSAVVSGLTLSTPATAASGVGGYAIAPADATAANYDITFVSGTLTVTQAPLTISADDKSKVYGAATPR